MEDSDLKAAREAAKYFGRMGGLIGGKRRAKALTATQRSEIARLGGQARSRNRKSKLRQSEQREGANGNSPNPES